MTPLQTSKTAQPAPRGRFGLPQLARPLDTLARKEKYFCKRDRRGVVYDRRAMLQVSRQLGHNRISVIVGHYWDE